MESIIRSILSHLLTLFLEFQKENFSILLSVVNIIIITMSIKIITIMMRVAWEITSIQNVSYRFDGSFVDMLSK